jgi:hypothetical protein
MSSRLRIRIVALVVVPVVGILATAAVGYRTVERVRIGSPEFDRVLLYSKVIGDTVPAPATLSDPYLLTIGLALAPDPATNADQIALLTKAEDGYRASIKTWTDQLAPVSGTDADTVRATMAQLVEPADRFWSLVDKTLVPAVRAGDGATATATVLGPIREAFQAHHDLGDTLSAQLVTAQSNQEAATRRMIEHQRDLAVAMVAAVTVVLLFAAVLLVRRPRSGRAGELGSPESATGAGAALVDPSSERVLAGV